MIAQGRWRRARPTRAESRNGCLRPETAEQALGVHPDAAMRRRICLPTSALDGWELIPAVHAMFHFDVGGAGFSLELTRVCENVA